jgi:DNA-binding NarL/FixJ family response regulator
MTSLATNPRTPASAPAPQPANLTRTQRDALIDEVAQSMAPDHKKAKPVDPLRPWWPQIKRKLTQGYSVRQITHMLSAPAINVKTSVRSIQRLINAHAHPKNAAAAPSAGAANADTLKS